MIKRSLSTIVLGPAFLGIIWLGGVYFDLVIGLIGLIGIHELFSILRVQISKGVRYIALVGFILVIILFVAEKYDLALILLFSMGVLVWTLTSKVFKDRCWIGLGYTYVLLASISFIYIRNVPEFGFLITIWFFVIIWTNDVGSYVVGTLIRGPLIVPAISPKKTWAGSMGGIFLSVIVSSLIFAKFSNDFSINMLMIAGICLAIVGQLGDMLESMFKRQFGIKDSGSIIPGHGGILDRFDSAFLGGPMMAIFLFFYGY